MKMSHDELRRKLYGLVNPDPQVPSRLTRWIRDVYPDRFIAQNEDGQMWEAAYFVDAEDRVSIGELVPVEVRYVHMELGAQGSEVPGEVQLIPYGEHTTDQGTFVLNEAGAAMVMANHARRKSQAVIDYEHQTLDGVEAPAAGWVKKLINKGKEGIWGEIEWTPRASDYLKNREYRYLSPVILARLSDGVVFQFKNAALTNMPAVDGMVALVNKKGMIPKNAKEGEMKMKELFNALGMKSGATEAEAVQLALSLMAQSKALGEMRKALGLADDVKPEDLGATVLALKGSVGEIAKAAGLGEEVKASEVSSVVMALKAGAAVPADVTEALGLKPGASVSEIKGTILALKQGSGQAGDLAQRIATLEAREAMEVVELALKDRKIVPAQRDWATKYAKDDLPGFKAFVAKAVPVLVDGGQKPGAGEAGHGLSDAQMHVCKQMGIDPKKFAESIKKKEEV